jgi:hypothetical protein
MVADATTIDTIVQRLLPKWSPLYTPTEIGSILSNAETMQGIESMRNIRPMSDEEAWDLAMRLDFSSRI